MVFKLFFGRNNHDSNLSSLLASSLPARQGKVREVSYDFMRYEIQKTSDENHTQGKGMFSGKGEAAPLP